MFWFTFFFFSLEHSSDLHKLMEIAAKMDNWLSWDNRVQVSALQTVNWMNVIKCFCAVVRQQLKQKWKWARHIAIDGWDAAQSGNQGEEVIKGTTKQKMARQHSREGGNHLEQESNSQKTMEGIDWGLHPAVDGQSLSQKWKVIVRKKQLSTFTLFTPNCTLSCSSPWSSNHLHTEIQSTADVALR